MIPHFHDVHVHTYPHSRDAHRRATLSAMLQAAADRGVWLVGLSNHLLPQSDFRIFQKLREEVRESAPPGMTVMVGAELCVLDCAGRIALSAGRAAQLDYVLAGPHHFAHPWVERPPTGSAAAFVAHQHQALLQAARHPLVHGVAHPWVINVQHAWRRWGFSLAEFMEAWGEGHFEELGQVAHQHDTALEIGMGIHLMAQHQGEAFWQTYRRGLQAARAAGARFYFGSDAHHRFVVARLDWLRPTLAQLGFTAEDIVDPLQWRTKGNEMGIDCPART